MWCNMKYGQFWDLFHFPRLFNKDCVITVLMRVYGEF